MTDPTPPPTLPRGRRLVLVDKPERTQCQMIMGCLGTDIHDEDHVALLVANTVFGGPFTSRMMQEIRVAKGWSYGASSRVGFDRQRDAFLMWCSPAAKDAPACLARCLELLEQWCQDGITDDELTFVKSYLVRSHAFEIDTPKKRVHQKLETALFDLPADYHERWLDRVRAVTREDANRAIRNRITPENLVIAVVGTQSDVAEPLKQAVSRLDSHEIVPFDIE